MIEHEAGNMPEVTLTNVVEPSDVALEHERPANTNGIRDHPECRCVSTTAPRESSARLLAQCIPQPALGWRQVDADVWIGTWHGSEHEASSSMKG